MDKPERVDEEKGPMTLDAFRSALRACAEGREPAGAAGSPSERELHELLVELFRFAQAVDAGVAYFLMELGAGPGMSTLQMKTSNQMIGNRVLALLDARPKALEGVRETLQRDRRFLLDLNEAYRAAIPRGIAKLLAELEPGEVAKKHRRLFGLLGAREALVDLGRKHAELAALPGPDLLERYFVEAFRDELARRCTA